MTKSGNAANRTLVVRQTQAEREALEARAKREGVTLSEIVREALDRYLWPGNTAPARRM